MKKIYTAEDLSKYGENVVAVRIENNEVYACGYIEENLNNDYPKYKDDPKTFFRFVEHGSGKHWKLDKNIYHGAFDSGNWLIEAMMQRQGEVPGDMYFEYEDPESWNKFDSVFLAFIDQFGCDENGECVAHPYQDIMNMFEMKNEEFSDLMDVLKDGVYIIAFE